MSASHAFHPGSVHRLAHPPVFQVASNPETGSSQPEAEARAYLGDARTGTPELPKMVDVS